MATIQNRTSTITPMYTYNKEKHCIEGAEMEEPTLQGSSGIEDFNYAMQQYAASLKSYPVKGEVKWIDGQEVLEGKEYELKSVCVLCGGDGIETCSNPDHGFISAVGGELGRLGCPVCGHDPHYKVKNGGKCEVCTNGMITESDYEKFTENYNYQMFEEPEFFAYHLQQAESEDELWQELFQLTSKWEFIKAKQHFTISRK